MSKEFSVVVKKDNKNLAREREKDEKYIHRVTAMRSCRYGIVPEFYKSFGKEISTDLLLINLRPYLFLWSPAAYPCLKDAKSAI